MHQQCLSPGQHTGRLSSIMWGTAYLYNATAQQAQAPETTKSKTHPEQDSVQEPQALARLWHVHVAQDLMSVKLELSCTRSLPVTVQKTPGKQCSWMGDSRGQQPLPI